MDQGSAYVYFWNATSWSQQAKLTASDGAPEDHFGVSAAISGDYAVIGAVHDDIGANADQGSAYVYFWNGTSWSQQAKLTASDGAPGDYFGYSVTIFGNYAVIGAYGDDIGANANQGSAYVFLRSGTIWSEQAKLTASDGAPGDYFGHSVASSGDYGVIGADWDEISGKSNQGSAYVFVSCEAPSITSHPQSETKCVGESVTFSVTASGFAPLTYEWRKDGSNIPGATSDSYTISAVATGDAANYDCVVTNPCRSATSDAATLTVNTPPTITVQPVSQTKIEGESVTLSVTASGTNPAYQWRKYEGSTWNNLSNGGNISGATTANLLIAGATADQAGWYDCHVTDTCGEVVSDVAHLVINTGAGAGRGDLNCDSVVDFDDINPFVLALSLGETEYYNQYPTCHFYNADVDSSGAVDFGDINPFVALLSGD